MQNCCKAYVYDWLLKNIVMAYFPKQYFRIRLFFCAIFAVKMQMAHIKVKYNIMGVIICISVIYPPPIYVYIQIIIYVF